MSMFLAQTLNIGIKKNKNDAVCFKLSDNTTLSLVSTKNIFAASPVLINKKHIRASSPKYIFVNSGNANACTGKTGDVNAYRYISELSKCFNCKREEILIFSTGIIGQQLPITRICKSISQTNFKFNSSLVNSARAIMTTDKYPKLIERSVTISGKKITIKAICKGAGMIEPNMATMLAFIFVDIKMRKNNLDKLLSTCVEDTFNKISVDGDMSTNDSVALIASGENADIDVMQPKNHKKLQKCMMDIFKDLSLLIVADGEGATKVCEILVDNAYSQKNAETLCYKIANSNLIKTALYGQDPNWGRIIAKVGSVSNLKIDPMKLILKINNIVVFKRGVPSEYAKSKKLVKSMTKRNIKIEITLGLGKFSHNLFTSDLSKKYVQINSDYTS